MGHAFVVACAPFLTTDDGTRERHDALFVALFGGEFGVWNDAKTRQR